MHSVFVPRAQVDKFSLAPVAKKLEEILGTTVTFVADCVGPEAEAAPALHHPLSILTPVQEGECV